MKLVLVFVLLTCAMSLSLKDRMQTAALERVGAAKVGAGAEKSSAAILDATCAEGQTKECDVYGGYCFCTNY